MIGRDHEGKIVEKSVSRTGLRLKGTGDQRTLRRASLESCCRGPWWSLYESITWKGFVSDCHTKALSTTQLTLRQSRT